MRKYRSLIIVFTVAVVITGLLFFSIVNSQKRQPFSKKERINSAPSLDRPQGDPQAMKTFTHTGFPETASHPGYNGFTVSYPIDWTVSPQYLSNTDDRNKIETLILGFERASASMQMTQLIKRDINPCTFKDAPGKRTHEVIKEIVKEGHTWRVSQDISDGEENDKYYVVCEQTPTGEYRDSTVIGTIRLFTEGNDPSSVEDFVRLAEDIIILPQPETLDIHSISVSNGVNTFTHPGIAPYYHGFKLNYTSDWTPTPEYQIKSHDGKPYGLEFKLTKGGNSLLISQRATGGHYCSFDDIPVKGNFTSEYIKIREINNASGVTFRIAKNKDYQSPTGYTVCEKGPGDTDYGSIATVGLVDFVAVDDSSLNEIISMLEKLEAFPIPAQ